MTTKGALFLSFVLLAQASFGGTKTNSYFPPDFNARYYPPYLAKMKEPSLYQQRTNKNVEIYRFVWLRSFHDPLSVRVEKQQSTLTVIITRLKGAGGDRPGIPAQKVLTVTEARWSRVTNSIATIGYWDMMAQEKFSGLDGARWILEGLKNGNYKVVERWSPDVDSSKRKSDAFGKACRYLLEIGGVDLQAEEVY